LSEELSYPPFSIRADSSKPAKIVQDPEGKLWLLYYDLDGQARKVPLSLVLFPQELGNLAPQIPVQDLFQQLRVKLKDSAILVPVDVQGSTIQVPVDIQSQYITLLVRFTSAMLATSASASIAAGGDGTVSVTVSSGEMWEICFTNHIGSGADISLTKIDVSPDGGTTYVPVSTSHLSSSRLVVSAGNIIRATYHNSGSNAETAYLNVVGRKLVV
jgi:hypothetical protein